MEVWSSTTEQPLEVVTRLLKFSWLDYTLFSGLIILSLLIGIYFGCFGNKQNTTSEYLLGSRSMSIFPVAVSLVAGHLSGITLLGVPTEIYMYGGQYGACVFTGVLCSIAITYIYLPTFYTLKVTSSYEYLHLRFDERIRGMALFLYVISTFLYIPIVIYVPALAFNHVSGISIHFITPILCSVCIFYTTIGGLKAVVWTDTLQYMLTVATMCMVLVLGLTQAGGFGNIWRIAGEGDRLDFFNFSPDPTVRTTFWGVVIGLTVSWISTLGVAPTAVQRFMSIPTLTKAKWTVLIFGLGVLLTKAIVCYCGYIMYAKYYNCDPFTSKKIAKIDQILPHYVLDVAYNIPGLPGLFISGVFSTALSTMSAHLNTLAGVLYKDFFSKFLSSKTSDETANNIIKLTVVVAGIISVALVFLVERLGGIIQISGCITGITSGPLLGLFTLGMLFPTATNKGALYGSIIALSFMTFIISGFQYHYINNDIVYDFKPLTTSGCNETLAMLNETILTTTPFNNNFIASQPFYLFRISFYWYPVIGCALVIIVGLLISHLPGAEVDMEKRCNKDLYSPIIHRFIPTNLEYKTVADALKTVHTCARCYDKPDDGPISYEEATKT